MCRPAGVKMLFASPCFNASIASTDNRIIEGYFVLSCDVAHDTLEVTVLLLIGQHIELKNRRRDNEETGITVIRVTAGLDQWFGMFWCPLFGIQDQWFLAVCWISLTGDILQLP